MKIFRKNQLVITALAALIAVAGYLNHIEKSEKSSAVEKVVELTEDAEKESAAESLIQAKGYKNVAVTISEDGVDVMVVADSLDRAARAQIEEIVKSKAGVGADKITITAVKNIEK